MTSLSKGRTTLPPGQHAVAGFPRFGTHFHHPPPTIPEHPTLEVRGAVIEPLTLTRSDVAAMPRREVDADFHCVAGWSATGLHWEGVPFATFYENCIEPLVAPGTAVSHLTFVGLDGYRSIVMIEDALVDDVLLADRLNGKPLDLDHGAPLRLVSPSQYGYVSTKHLCRIEVCDGQPSERRHPSPLVRFGLELVKPHRRARVWQEERHRYLPSRVLRPVYWYTFFPVIRFLCGRGSRAR